jgi:hypothetical protein
MNSRTQRWFKSRLLRYTAAFLVTALILFVRGVLDPMIGSYAARTAN